jgi:DNA N-6-adenine-methyltransferase Dam
MAKPRQSARARKDQAAREQQRFESARAMWVEEPQPAEPPFDLNAAKDRLGVLWRAMDRLDRLKSAQAREAGDLLIKVKEALPHGKFIPWMKASLPFSVDKARDLMNHAMACVSAEALSKPLPDYAPSQMGHGARFGGKDSPQDCRTPARIIEAARLTLGGTIDLDPATSKKQNDEIVHATHIFTEQDDGLTKPWHGRVWLNPPWNNAAGFTTKLIEEHQAGRVKAAILLVNGLSMLAKWWAPIWNQPLCLARVPFFIVAKGKTEPTTPIAAIAYFGPDEARFFKHFFRVGPIVKWSTLGYDPIYDEYEDAPLREATFPDEEE